jgi:hypothetical protein
MSAEIVRFPTRRVVRNRFYWLESDQPSELTDLDRAARQLDRAIRALQRQRLSVMGQWRAALTREVAAKRGGDGDAA